MNKRNIILNVIVIIFVMFIGTLNIYATSDLKHELSETEYNNLINLGFDDELINNLSDEEIQKYKNYTVEKQVREVKYFKEVKSPFPLADGEDYTNIEVSEEEYNKSPQLTRRTTVETTYKKLELTLTLPTSDTKRMVLASLKWKKVPATKSYDVFALYSTSGRMNIPTAHQYMTELAPSSINNCLLGDKVTHTTDYLPSNSNWNTKSAGIAYYGAGISMQLDTNITPCWHDFGLVTGQVQGYRFTMMTTATPDLMEKLRYVLHINMQKVLLL